MIPAEFPVVVAGGGPAGAAAALTLAREGRRVLLVEGPAADFRIGEALPPAARPLLRDLGVLPRFLADGHLPAYGNVAVWGSAEPHVHDFIFDPQGHGWHLDRVRFDALLRAAAREAGATVLPGASVRTVTRTTDGWALNVPGADQTIHCRWLLDATGRRSALARQCGAVRGALDPLVAFFARFRPASNERPDADTRTVIEAVSDGWWYAALVPSGERIVAFLTDADLADRAVWLSAAGFGQRLAATAFLGPLLAARGYALHGRPRGTDAASGRLDRAAGPGWLAAGDAALAFDPLSSQGILNALYTGLRAGQAVGHALDGEASALVAYAQRLDSIYAAYQQHRLTYYAAEIRWTDQPFWQRRRAAAGVVVPPAGVGAE